MNAYVWIVQGLLSAWCLLGAHAASAQARIAVLDGDVTTILFALGAEDRIVAMPGDAEHTEQLPHVQRFSGYVVKSAETILNSQPDTVITSSVRGAPAILRHVEQAGVTVLRLNEAATEAAAVERIQAVANYLGMTAQGEALSQRFQTELAQSVQAVHALSPKPKAVFILAGGGRPTIVGGGDTLAGQVLTLAGAENVAQAIQGYRLLSAEALTLLAPDVIFTNAEGLHEEDGAVAVLMAPGARYTPAAQHGRLITIPTGYLQGFGLRTPEAVRALSEQLHHIMSQPIKAGRQP